jgi:hypothetical protein
MMFLTIIQAVKALRIMNKQIHPQRVGEVVAAVL